MNFQKSYQSDQDGKGLYYVCDQAFLKKRRRIIELWETLLCSDSNQILCPVLIPRKYLELSGHVPQFGQEILKLQNSTLCLRPETAAAAFANLKSIRRSLRGNPLKLHTVGKAFRKEKSSRTSVTRKNQFEQLQLQVLSSPIETFFQQYLPRLQKFFESLNVSVKYYEVPAENRPHYAKRTIDILATDFEDLEIGCVNYRGTHDLHQFSEKQKSTYQVYQISLGLDRLMHVGSL